MNTDDGKQRQSWLKGVNKKRKMISARHLGPLSHPDDFALLRINLRIPACVFLCSHHITIKWVKARALTGCWSSCIMGHRHDNDNKSEPQGNNITQTNHPGVGK